MYRHGGGTTGGMAVPVLPYGASRSFDCVRVRVRVRVRACRACVRSVLRFCASAVQPRTRGPPSGSCLFPPRARGRLASTGQARRSSRRVETLSTRYLAPGMTCRRLVPRSATRARPSSAACSRCCAALRTWAGRPCESRRFRSVCAACSRSTPTDLSPPPQTRRVSASGGSVTLRRADRPLRRCARPSCTSPPER